MVRNIYGSLSSPEAFKYQPLMHMRKIHLKPVFVTWRSCSPVSCSPLSLLDFQQSRQLLFRCGGGRCCGRGAGTPRGRWRGRSARPLCQSGGGKLGPGPRGARGVPRVQVGLHLLWKAASVRVHQAVGQHGHGEVVAGHRQRLNKQSPNF